MTTTEPDPATAPQSSVIPGWEVWFLLAVLGSGGGFATLVISSFIGMGVARDPASPGEVVHFTPDPTRIVIGAMVALVCTSAAVATIRRTDWGGSVG